jgi:glycosyltransferase involved in cell wall biosynthesis
VLFAGRLEGQKRPLVLPAVAAALAADLPDVQVVVAGTGSLAKDLVAASRREAPGRVHLLGSVAQERLADLMAVSDVLVLPSAFEGLPNVVLEALASGTPVVATRHGGRTAEVLGDAWAGRLSGPAPTELAAALRAVLAWNGRGTTRRRQIAEGFSAEAINGPIYQEFIRLSHRPKKEVGRPLHDGPPLHRTESGVRA